MAKLMRLEREAAVKYTADPEKAERLQALGYVITEEEVILDAVETTEVAPENTEVTDVPEPETQTDLTVPELRERLTAAGIDAPKSAKKDMLVSIAQANGVPV